jgi:amino acid adenylation domain-containing protein
MNTPQYFSAIRRAVAADPEKVAVIASGATISYRELDRLSNGFALQLAHLGVESESIVGIFTERGVEMISAVLGIHRAGGAYLPLNPEYPDDRVHLMLSDSGAQVVITTSALRSRLRGFSGKILCLEEVMPSDESPVVSVPSDSLAYMIYTSGSTGIPKGVMVTHANLESLLVHACPLFDFRSEDVWIMSHQLSFDVSVWEIFGAFWNGSTLVVPSEAEMESMHLMKGLVMRYGVTILNQTPPAFHVLKVELLDEALIPVRYVIFAGDRLNTAELRVFSRRFSGVRLVNMYGITETTVHTTFIELSSADLNDATLSVGIPLPHLSVYLLEGNQQPVPPGTEGEIYVGGAGVARGYLNRPELNAERFLPDPFAGVEGARMYRSGDLGCLRPDGGIDYLGRMDFQVKIRGFRIELGEVQSALSKCQGVDQCVVMAQPDPSGNQRLVGYVVMKENSDGTSRILGEISGKLPPQMVPSLIISLETMPLTENGKVDRKALPLPESIQSATKDGNYIAPRNETERAIADLWSRHLGVSTVGIRDDFFALGGHSLMAAIMIHDLEKIIGEVIPLVAFQENPTIEGILAFQDSGLNEKRNLLHTFNGNGTKPPLFCLYHLSGDVNFYKDLARELGPDQPVYGILSPAYFDQAMAPASMEEAASRIVSLLRERFEERFGGSAPMLVGYSWAGWLAVEVARQWMEQGGAQPYVCVLGMPAPYRRLSRWGKLAHMLRWLPFWIWDVLRDGSTWRRLLAAMSRFAKKPVFAEAPNVQDWSKDGLPRHHIELGNRYQPVLSKPIRIHLIREIHDYRKHAHPLHYYTSEEKTDAGWTALAGIPPLVTWIDTKHRDLMLPPDVIKLAEIVRHGIAEFSDWNRGGNLAE